MVGVEVEHKETRPLHQGRVEPEAGLLYGQVVIFAVVAGQGSCQGAVALHCLVGVGVEVPGSGEEYLISSGPAHFRFFFSLTEAVHWKGKGSFFTSHSATVPSPLSPPISTHLMG